MGDSISNLLFLQNFDSEAKMKDKYYSFTLKEQNFLIQRLFVALFMFFAIYSLCFASGLNDVLATLISVSVVGLGIFIYFKKFYSKFDDNVKCKLQYFIKHNNFYKEDVKEKLVTDTRSKSVSFLSYKPTVRYRYDKNNFTVGFLIDGSSMSIRFKLLTEELSHLFNLKFKEKIISMDGFMEYTFILAEDKALIVNKDTDFNKFIDKEGNIKLTDKLTWSFTKYPHALITGATGSGKTILAFYLVRMFIQISGIDCVKIVDPKKSDLAYLKEVINPNNVEYEPNRIAKLIREFTELMNKRYDDMRNHPNYAVGKNYNDYSYRPQFLIFDEVAAFMLSCDKKIAQEVNASIIEIILKGRQAGMFCILLTQRPDVDSLPGGGKIRDNLSLRVCLGKMSSVGYRMIYDTSEDLEMNDYKVGEGYCIIDGALNKPTRIRFPFIDKNYDFFADIKNLHQISEVEKVCNKYLNKDGTFKSIE